MQSLYFVTSLYICTLDRVMSDDHWSLSLNETMDHLAMAYSVHWYCHVLRREDGHFLRMVLDFEVDGQKRKGRLKRTWRKHVEEESVNVDFRREDVLCRLKWSVGVTKIAAGLR